MQSASFRIWTRVTVSISYDDNYYTTYQIISSNVNQVLYFMVFEQAANNS